MSYIPMEGGSRAVNHREGSLGHLVAGDGGRWGPLGGGRRPSTPAALWGRGGPWRRRRRVLRAGAAAGEEEAARVSSSPHGSAGEGSAEGKPRRRPQAGPGRAAP